MTLLATLLAVAASAVAAWLAVALAGARRRHARALGERGWLLERDRETAARAAVDEERARIARELHDIVSHNVSVMIVQTTAAREVLAVAPEAAASAMEAVEAAGRTTMTELRHLLGLLAPPADGVEDDLLPQPGLTRLGALVDRIAFAGLPVEVRLSGEARPLPSGIDATAYRIVQEALTNALKHGSGKHGSGKHGSGKHGSGKHGSGGKAEVTIRYTDHAVRVEILTTGPSVLTSPAPPPPRGAGPADADVKSAAAHVPTETGIGRGLLGLRQRVAVYGGDLDARRRLGGGYRVRARIPVEDRR
ncbi:histidine kinase [Actinoplanes sp. NPDC051851]|uniref:sensor histidine kinase n=1 Tax=Actinoplanes sp. NPDC051851 TaxID=3154753 RepID=UPI00343CDCC0